jgi:hypothetical protein
VRVARVAYSLGCGLIALIAAPPVHAQGAQGGVVERDVVDLSPARGARIDRLDVNNRLGDVRIEGHDRDAITIIAVKRAPDQETLDRLKVSLIPDPNGQVIISTALLAGQEVRPIPAGSVRIDLIVKTPRAAQVQAQVWKGRIAVTGVENGAELSTDDGDIDVSEVTGSVSTQSGHGRHSFARVFGTIDARTVDGDLDLDVVRGERIVAVVHAGHISGRRVRVREMSILVTRGTIRIHGDAVAGGRYRIASYWGDVEVRLGSGGGKAAPVRVRAHSRDGQVTLPSGLRRRVAEGDGAVTGTLGSGRHFAELDLRTHVGSITVAEF